MSDFRVHEVEQQLEKINSGNLVLDKDVTTADFDMEKAKSMEAFFKEQGIPVLFQYADYTGKSMEGRFRAEVKNEAAKHGLDDIRRSGGSPITYSEMRRAAKISKEASLRPDDSITNTPILFTPGAKV